MPISVELLLWPRLALSVVHRSGVRPSVRLSVPSFFEPYNWSRGVFILTVFLTLIVRAAHTFISSDYYEDGHTCFGLSKPQ